MGCLALVAALRDEVRGIEDRLRGASRVDGAVRFLRGILGGREVVLCLTGIGAERAQERMRCLLGAADIDEVLAFGFAGALDPSLAAGDLVLASEVVSPPPPLGIGPEAIPADARLRIRASGLGPGRFALVSGRLLTAARVLVRSREKTELGETFGALAVDMESVGILRAAREAGAPALCARAIVDTLVMDLPPDLDAFVAEDGTLRARKAMWAVMRRPRDLRGLLELRRAARLAQRSLTAFVLRYCGADGRQA